MCGGGILDNKHMLCLPAGIPRMIQVDMLTFLDHFLELGAHHYDGWSRKVRDKQAEKTHTQRVMLLRAPAGG
jgi:hypothetical protein